MDTSEYEDMVKHPGKFEGEPRYSPYYYDQAGQSGQDDSFIDSDDVEHFLFFVTDDDRAIFPELSEVQAIHGYESDTGFWNTEECTRKEWDRFAAENEYEEQEE